MSNIQHFHLPAYQNRVGGLRRKKGHRNLSHESVGSEYSLDHYRNELPESDTRYYQTDSTYFTDQHDVVSAASYPYNNVSFDEVPRSGGTSSDDLPKSGYVVDHPPHENFLRVQASKGSWQPFLWPGFAICVPMILLSAGLLYIALAYVVNPGTNVFDRGGERHAAENSKYLLVNFSATKLVFLASFLSTLAPLLAGCIMSLVTILVFYDLKRSSDVAYFPQLPTPYQISLLTGLLAASYEQLYNSFLYLLSRKRTAKASPVLLYALGIFALTVVLGLAVAITDAYLHVATQTVSITLYSKEGQARLDLGKGLNSYCLGVDRVRDNFGFPCSAATVKELSLRQEWRQGQSEMQRIAHNTSDLSTMRLAELADSNLRLAFLTPTSNYIPSRTNYLASTIGVGATCSLIPPTSCNTSIWGSDDIYTSFNCSANFWGTLGLTPPEHDIAPGSGKAITPYLSFLAINQNANLIYNYFADNELETVYNTADLNASALVPDEGANPWTDAELKNPVYLAFAWRTATGSFQNFSKNGMVSSNLVQKYNRSGSFIDYFLKCEVASYDVSYVYNNGSMEVRDLLKHDNGTVMNLWTGMADYLPRVSGSDWNLQDYNVQSAIAGNTTMSYEKRFGELIAQDALSTIGAFTSGRLVHGEQDQTEILVARVPKAALGALLACALLYPVLGITLLIKAKLAAEHSGPITPLFSYWGLSWAAFLENNSPGDHNTGIQSGVVSRDQEEAYRLFIRDDDKAGTRFGLYRRSRAGYVTEIERSQSHRAAWL